MVYETSVLDSEEVGVIPFGFVFVHNLPGNSQGIRFRGLSIPECQAQLPKV